MINKEKIKEAYDSDIHWLDTILDEVEKNDKDFENSQNIYDLINNLYLINEFVVETEINKTLSKYNVMVQDLYSEMKIDLTKMIDYEEMWEEL